MGLCNLGQGMCTMCYDTMGLKFISETNVCDLGEGTLLV